MASLLSLENPVLDLDGQLSLHDHPEQPPRSLSCQRPLASAMLAPTKSAARVSALLWPLVETATRATAEH